MKTTSRDYYTIPGTDIEVELPHQPDSIMEYHDPIIRITDDHIEVGYLAHDDSCENPLADDGYAGHIYEARRHGPTLRDYERELALGDYEGRERNPYAVLLDVYEHSGIAYSLNGEGMQCRFDTARGGAVWVPSKALLEDAPKDPEAARAWARANAKLAADEYTDWCNGRCYGVVVATYDKSGEAVDHDACWGYVGDDSALEALKEAMKEGA